MDGHLSLRQLRYAGLFEAIRIRKAGYAYRAPHETFVRAYSILCATVQREVLPRAPIQYMQLSTLTHTHTHTHTHQLSSSCNVLCSSYRQLDVVVRRA